MKKVRIKSPASKNAVETPHDKLSHDKVSKSVLLSVSVSQVGYKGPPSESTAVTHLVKDEESCPAGVEGAGTGVGDAGAEAGAVDGLATKGVPAAAEFAMTSEDVGESESGCAAVTAVDMQDSTQSLSQSLSLSHAVVGEPFHKYLVGFGRNPFGRFSLTAAFNEKTGVHHLSLL